jgi:hypothetical protein
LTRVIGKKIGQAVNLQTSMKLIASILLVVFSLTVTLPLAQSLLSKDQVTFSVVDEEKSSSNQLNEIKEDKKDTTHQFYFALFSIQPILPLDLYCLLQSKIPTAPLLEKTTPPPNFC